MIELMTLLKLCNTSLRSGDTVIEDCSSLSPDFKNVKLVLKQEEVDRFKQLVMRNLKGVDEEHLEYCVETNDADSFIVFCECILEEYNKNNGSMYETICDYIKDNYNCENLVRIIDTTSGFFDTTIKNVSRASEETFREHLPGEVTILGEVDDTVEDVVEDNLFDVTVDTDVNGDIDISKYTSDFANIESNRDDDVELTADDNWVETDLEIEDVNTGTDNSETDVSCDKVEECDETSETVLAEETLEKVLSENDVALAGEVAIPDNITSHLEERGNLTKEEIEHTIDVLKRASISESEDLYNTIDAMLKMCSVSVMTETILDYMDSHLDEIDSRIVGA